MHSTTEGPRASAVVATEPVTRPATERLRPPTLIALVTLAVAPFVALHLRLTPVDDPDAFWHVLSGQHVWTSHQVVVADPYGWFSTNTWVQIDWLSDLAMAGLYALAGLAGVSWMYTTLGILLMGSLYALTRQVADPLVAGIVALTAWAGTSASQAFRPQTVSFVLLAISLLAWRRVQNGSGSVPWWLVPLSWVWACSHGLWFLGPLVGLAVVTGLAFDRTLERKYLLRLAAVPLSSIAAGALTPIGPSILASPFTVNSYAGLVSEYRPPDIHEPYVAATVLLLAVAAIGWGRATERASWADILLWGMAFGFLLLYARTVALGAIIAAALAAAALTMLLPLPAAGGGRRLECILLPAAGLAAIIAAAVLAPSLAGRAGDMPTALDTAIDELPADTVVFNDDGVGGWLLLEHPDVHPVIDTRTYLFDIPYITDYMQARAARSGWQGFLTDTGAQAALLRTDEPLVEALTTTAGWRQEETRDGFVLLVAPGIG